jgi:putative phage-type endonuclease
MLDLVTEHTTDVVTQIEKWEDEGRRAAWLAARRQAITATDAPKILGVSKYGSAIDVYLDKTGALLEPTVVTDAMEAGNFFQDRILQYYERKQRERLVLCDPLQFTVSTTEPLIGASLDARRVRDGAPVDAKNIGRPSFAEWGEAGTDQMPLYYAVQLAIQMHVTDAERADLAVLFHGQELRVYTLERNRELEAEMIGRCVEFWHANILAGVPPEVDGSASLTKHLARTFGTHTDLVVKSNEATDDLAARLSAAKQAKEDAEALVDGLSNKIRAAIGDARAIEGPRWKATWALAKDSIGVDYEAVAKALALDVAQATGQAATKVFADLAAQHTGVTKKGSRRFTFTYSGR